MKIKHAVKALVQKDKKVLVLFKSKDEEITPNTWDLPGGRKNDDETDESAVKREVLEEANIETIVEEKIAEWEGSPKEGLLLHVNFYLCKYVSGEAKPSEEHELAIWMDLVEMQEQNVPEWITEKAKKIIGA